jgi:cell division protein FtsL
MATLPAFLRKPEPAPAGDSAYQPVAAYVPSDPYQMRPLPLEDVFFHCKRIDNSRLVRTADPKSRGACLRTLGVASAAVLLLVSLVAPSVAVTMAGYRLEALRTEERRLTEERRGLELEVARLLSPDRLDKLAHEQTMAPAAPGQVVRLDRQDGSAVAMAKE